MVEEMEGKCIMGKSLLTITLKCNNCGEVITVQSNQHMNFLFNNPALPQHWCKNGEIGILTAIKTNQHWKEDIE